MINWILVCDTLLDQHWEDEPFEVIVSNSPYSIRKKTILLINDQDILAGF